MPGKILQEGIFNSQRTLQDEVEQLSDPKIDIEAERVANLVVKYLANFSQGGGYEDRKMEESDIERAYERIQGQLGKGFIRTIYRTIFGTAYQERMLSCPSSVSIVKDIISRPLHDILGNRKHFVIDAGSGSGILQIAFYIQARRAGLIPSIDTSRGIEINKKAQRKSDTVLRKLGVGHVVHGSSLDSHNYTSLGTDFIHSYGNENLVDAMNDVRGEPFIPNLQTLWEVYGERLSETQIVPYYTSFFVSQIATNKISEDIEGGIDGDSIPVFAFSGDIPKFLSEVRRRIEIAFGNPSMKKSTGLFFPSDIQITPDSEMMFLEELGKEWIGNIFKEHPGTQNFPFNSSTRWTLHPKEFIRSIPETE